MAEAATRVQVLTLPPVHRWPGGDALLVGLPARQPGVMVVGAA